VSAPQDKPPRRLTGTQRKYLRGLAHPLSPVVLVGRSGINDAVIAATDRALADHELIKVKIAATRDERERMAAEIERACGAALAGTVGTIAILYRPHEQPDRRRIVLPPPAAAATPIDGEDGR